MSVGELNGASLPRVSLRTIQISMRKHLTQVQAAKLFGVSQPRVSDLVRGKVSLFTIDMLVNMLGKARRRVLVRTTAVRAT